MTRSDVAAGGPPRKLSEDAVLEEIQRRVLWLATRIVDAANRDRPPDEVKVGGHQASSTSLVTVMTALWFAHLDRGDRVSVKPHASPVFHAIQYLLGRLDPSYLTALRSLGGLQSYPSRTKDPDGVDFSTGSVGLGAAAPLFAAATRRYVDAHFGRRPPARFIALIGDAELDEGNVWEAVADPATEGLGNVTWVVDFNRQSLDRVIPGVRIQQWTQQFEAAGWHVIEVKYGRHLEAAFAQPGGGSLRRWLDEMPNEHYQALFGLEGETLRKTLLDGASGSVVDFVEQVPDGRLYELITDLGGHDLSAVRSALAACDAVTDRPSVVFAYTIKGWGLPIAGNARNHALLLDADQIDSLRSAAGLTPANEWARFDPATEAGRLVAERATCLTHDPPVLGLNVRVPVDTGIAGKRSTSTQQAFGRVLVNLSRDEGVAPYLVTTAPDVATSTNLAGFINRLGVFSAAERRSWADDPVLRWAEGPTGQHIELGISEMNLFSLLGQLGLSWDLSRQPLIPIGTLYDPFVCRGLDALIYAAYNGASFIVAGTPSGVTLAPEGGAHQSSITPSIGIELPAVTFLEPTYAVPLDWLLCDAVAQIAAGRPGAGGPGPVEPTAFYLRLTTRPISQAPFEAARQRLGDAVLRRMVINGAYRLHEADDVGTDDAPVVYLVGCGAVVPEVLEAAAILSDEGVAAHVIDLTSPGRLYRGWQAAVRRSVRTATEPSLPGALRACFPVRAPVVTIHDASSHALAWIGSALGVPAMSLGVDDFGQSGTIHELYELHDLLPGHIVNAALAVLTLR